MLTDNYVRCPVCGSEHTDHTGNEPCRNCGVPMDMPMNGPMELIDKVGEQ